MLTTCTLLAVLCGLGVATGEPVALLGVVFFGGCGLSYLLLSHPPTTGGSPVEFGDGAVPYGTLPGARRYTSATVGLVFPGRRAYAVGVLVGAVAFVVAGTVMVLVGLHLGIQSAAWGFPSGATLGVGLLAVGFFGVCGILGLRSLFAGPGGIALLPEGVYLEAGAGRAWVRWADLARSRVGGMGEHSYLALYAHTADGITVTGLQRVLHPVNRRLFRFDASIPQAQMRAAASDVVSAIYHYWGDPPSMQPPPEAHP
ncbi:hypothetical protein [Lipingzhangella rawalii]|uniref:hypothetical protein n=1 Tax=Lipingzhangella rawalii TaxID=2055835 RepID=UPI00287BBF73|nr:hypothetical protein [Lipingzhangella rawalii]